MPAAPLPRLALLVALLLAPGCGLLDVFGESDDASAGDPGDPGGPTGGWTTYGSDGATAFTSWATAGESTYGPIEPTGADNDPEAGCPCSPGTDLIYVVSDLGTLWSYDPKDDFFARKADVACGGMQSTFSMGVSRKARAWIQYQSGDLYTVDLGDGADPIPCKDPGFVPPVDPKYINFGMAFVAESLADPCDKLYAHAASDPDLIGPGVGALGVIDPQSLVLSTIAPIDYAWGELTGSGDGRLFAFEGAAPALLTEYDKATGAVLDTLPLPGLKSESAFAFAWYAGDFYLFTDPDPFGSISQVWHLDYDGSDGGGQALTYLGDAPIRIVGAGVSTCVPWGPT